MDSHVSEIVLAKDDLAGEVESLRAGHPREALLFLVGCFEENPKAIHVFSTAEEVIGIVCSGPALVGVKSVANALCKKDYKLSVRFLSSL